MASEFKVKMGKKLTQKEADKIGADKGTDGHPTPPLGAGDVTGQHREFTAYCCPHCGAVNWIWRHDVVWEWFRCWNCHLLFLA